MFRQTPAQRIARGDVFQGQSEPRPLFGAAEPRGHNRSTRTRVPSLWSAGSYTRLTTNVVTPPPTTISVEVPCASTLPSALSTRASAEMIRRPWDDDPRLGADAAGFLADRPGKIGLGLDRGEGGAGRQRESPAQPVALSISVSAQPPCTPPIGFSRCAPGSPSKAAKPSPTSVIQNESGRGDRRLRQFAVDDRLQDFPAGLAGELAGCGDAIFEFGHSNPSPLALSMHLQLMYMHRPMSAPKTTAERRCAPMPARWLEHCAGWNSRLAARRITQFLDREIGGMSVAQLGLMAQIAVTADDTLGRIGAAQRPRSIDAVAQPAHAGG